MKQKRSPVARSRRAAKRESIVQALQREIARGKFPPGQRLPKQTELARRFGVSVLTVQRAVDHLAHQGFIQTRHSQGTFVVERPPHLHHYALIFHSDPTDLQAGGWSHFYATLVNEAAKIQHAGQCTIECFYGVREPTEFEYYQRLVAKVKAHQFAGLIFASHPARLVGSPVMEWEGVARVAMMTYDPRFGKIPAVQFDPIAWFEKACDYLVARGRRRVAFIMKPSPAQPFEWDQWLAILANHGLVTRPHWNLPMPLWSFGAQHVVQLLMQSAGERPDSLLVMDDNAVEPTVAGLMAAGVRVPDDVEVVAHANFPRSGPGVLPLKWLGYDNTTALRTCMAIIDQQCRGEKPPLATTIGPMFEAELTNHNLPVELAPSRA